MKLRSLLDHHRNCFSRIGDSQSTEEKPLKEKESELAMPQFSATLLGLLGISAGTYVGFKLLISAGRKRRIRRRTQKAEIYAREDATFCLFGDSKRPKTSSGDSCCSSNPLH